MSTPADTRQQWYLKQMRRHADNVIREMGWAQMAYECGSTLGPFITSGDEEYGQARLAAHFARLAVG